MIIIAILHVLLCIDLLYFMSKVENTIIQQNLQRSKIYQPNNNESQNNDSYNLKIKQLQFSLDIAHKNNNISSQKIKKLQKQLNLIIQIKNKKQFELNSRIKLLQQYNKQCQCNYQSLKKQTDLKSIISKQHMRINISAAIHHTQQQLSRAKFEIQKQFLSQCEQLKVQMMQKDEKLRLTIKKLDNYNKNAINVSQQHEQYLKILDFIKQIGNIEQLNNIIHHQQADLLHSKKQMKLMITSHRQLQNQLKQITILKNKLLLSVEQKNIQIRHLQDKLKDYQQKLQQQRQINNNLQNYYNNKWKDQYQLLKLSLNKIYQSKLRLIKQQFNNTISSFDSNKQNYIHLHQQDIKKITILQQQVTQLVDQIKQNREVINKLQIQNNNIKIQIKQTHKSLIQLQKTSIIKTQLLLKDKIIQIKQLKQQLKKQIQNKIKIQNKLIKNNKKIKQQFQKQKNNILKQYNNKIQNIIIQKQIQKQSIISHKNKQIIQYQQKQKQIKIFYQNQILNVQNKHQKYQKQIQQQIINMKSKIRQCNNQYQTKQTILQQQIQKLKKYNNHQYQKLKKINQQKTILIRNLHQKSKHDQNIKKQLRYLYDLKNKDYQHISKENNKLIIENKNKQNIINQLNYTLLHNDSNTAINKLHQQFRTDLLALNQIHWKQQQIYRSKIQQLQNIICRRHVQDQQKLQGLCQQNQLLQSKLEVIKRRHSQQYQQSPSNNSCLSFIQPRKSVFLTQRKRRKNFHISRPYLKNMNQNSTAAAIIRMKRFLERGNSVGADQILTNSQRYLRRKDQVNSLGSGR